MAFIPSFAGEAGSRRDAFLPADREPEVRKYRHLAERFRPRIPRVFTERLSPGQTPGSCRGMCVRTYRHFSIRGSTQGSEIGLEVIARTARIAATPGRSLYRACIARGPPSRSEHFGGWGGNWQQLAWRFLKTQAQRAGSARQPPV